MVSSNARLPSAWTIADALKVHADDPTTTMPVIAQNFPVIDDALWQWDTGALRRITGETVTFKGWYVMWSLVAERAQTGDDAAGWHNRNAFAFIGYYYSRNGIDWTFGGRLLKTSADLRPDEWSGSLIMRQGSENVVDMFYTSVNTDVNQSVPSVSSGTIHADDSGVWFEGFTATTEMFSADGLHYANASQDPYFDFRDPHPFINPADGQVYCLFEGNVPGMRGEFVITDREAGHLPPGYTVGEGAGYGAAAIGIARLVSSYAQGDFSRWEMLPALVTALGVNDQTERPHVVFRNGLTYVFTISHHSTYTGGLNGPDGVYGFVSRHGIFGPYTPLNSSGLVLGNPSAAPYETYSHFVDPMGYVQSFIDTLPAPGTDPQAPATYRIGGTLAPTVRIVLEDDRTFLTEVHDYGQIFAFDEWAASNQPDPRPAT